MIYHRPVANYEAYVYKQGTKARNRPDYVKASNSKRFRGFVQHFNVVKSYLHMGKILCLGARTGCEVRAARALGFEDSIGVDLFPIGDLVIQGDWHNLPFTDNSFENVFSNSLDHCLDLDKLVLEVKRVLITNGIFVYESDTCYALDSRTVPLSMEEILNPVSNRNPLNAMWWDSLKDIADAFVIQGFEIIHKYTYGKYSGYILRKL